MTLCFDATRLPHDCDVREWAIANGLGDDMCSVPLDESGTLWSSLERKGTAVTRLVRRTTPAPSLHLLKRCDQCRHEPDDAA
jgi:hypothetical protein